MLFQRHPFRVLLIALCLGPFPQDPEEKAEGETRNGRREEEAEVVAEGLQPLPEGGDEGLVQPLLLLQE